MKLFGLHILTERGLVKGIDKAIEEELSRRNHFDDKQVSVLLSDNTKLRFLISEMKRKYRKFLKKV